MFANTSLGFCKWDLPALIVLLIVIAIFLWNRHKLKKQESELEDQLAEKTANETVTIDEV